MHARIIDGVQASRILDVRVMLATGRSMFTFRCLQDDRTVVIRYFAQTLDVPPIERSVDAPAGSPQPSRLRRQSPAKKTNDTPQGAAEAYTQRCT